MAPFGQGNPLPAFLSRRVEVLERRLLGGKGEHLRLKVKQAGTVWDAIAFGMGGEAAKAHSLLDIVYNLEVDRWNGVRPAPFERPRFRPERLDALYRPLRRPL